MYIYMYVYVYIYICICIYIYIKVAFWVEAALLFWCSIPPWEAAVLWPRGGGLSAIAEAQDLGD